MNSVNTMALPSPIQTLSDNARWLYPLSVVVLATLLGQFFGLGLGLLIVGGGTLGASIWLIWSSLQGLNSEAPITLEEAISLGAPSVEEEQKRAVLRALKDLEYERSVGKISDEDYASLSEHYRTEAKRLLRAVDQDLSPERERAERLLAERLAAQTPSPTASRAAARRVVESKSVESRTVVESKAVVDGSAAVDALPVAEADSAAEVERERAAKGPASDVAPRE
jgi:hypothetical protein